MLSEAMKFFITPSFKLVLLDFGLSAASLALNSILEWPFLCACAAYWFILGTATAVIACFEEA